MIEPLLVILCGYLDRLRGTDWSIYPAFTLFNKRIAGGDVRLIYGWVVAALYGHEFDLLTLPIILLFALGESFGWGEPLGAALEGRKQNQDRLERWQTGILKEDPWLSLIIRGFMWGLPVALLSWFDPLLMSLPAIFMVTMPLAVLLVKNIPAGVVERWSWQETIRGLLTGLIILGVTNG